MTNNVISKNLKNTFSKIEKAIKEAREMSLKYDIFVSKSEYMQGKSIEISIK